MNIASFHYSKFKIAFDHVGLKCRILITFFTLALFRIPREKNMQNDVHDAKWKETIVVLMLKLQWSNYAQWLITQCQCNYMLVNMYSRPTISKVPGYVFWDSKLRSSASLPNYNRNPASSFSAEHCTSWNSTNNSHLSPKYRKVILLENAARYSKNLY